MAKFVLQSVILLLSSNAVIQTVSGTSATLVLYSSNIDSTTEEDIESHKAELASEYYSAELTNLILHDLKTTSCQGQEALAVNAFIKELFVKKTNVTAIVGPSCTDSAFTISKLINRGHVPIVHLHTSPLPAALASKVSNSFGVQGPIELRADAGIALIQYSNWSRVIAFYQDTSTEMNFMFNHFQKALVDRNLTGTLGHTSIVNRGYNSLVFTLSKYAIRIIYLMLDKDLARKVLCTGYHNRAFHPDYQWVILRTTLDDILPTGYIYTDTGEMCDGLALQTVLEQAIIIGYYTEGVINQITPSTVYRNTLRLLVQGLHLSKSTNLTLSESLNRIEGTVDRRVSLVQVQRNSSILVADYETTQNRLVLHYTIPLTTIPSNFTRISDTVSQEVFYITLALLVILLLITVTLQVLTIFYRNTSSIKATSPKVQQLAYFGIYLIIFTILIYSVQKSQIIDDIIYAHLCNTHNFIFNVGFTLLFGTLCVKAWRLYRIFNHYMDPGNLLSHKALVLIILGMTLATITVCILWIAVGKPVRIEIPLRVDYERRVEIVRDICRTRYFFVWFTSVSFYHLVLLLTATVLSIKLKTSVPKHQKQFRRNEVTLLTYIIVITVVIGYPTYYLAQYITGNLLLEYIVAIFIHTCLIVAYQVLFFASPLLHAMRETKMQKFISTKD